MMPKLEFFPRVLSKIEGVGGKANVLPMSCQCLANVLPLPQRPSPVSQFEFTVQNHAKVS